MTLPTSGPLSLADIQAEFGGVNPIGLDEYYRDGAYVTPNNTSVPTTGPISAGNFYGAGAAATMSYIGSGWTSLAVGDLAINLSSRITTGWTKIVSRTRIQIVGSGGGNEYIATIAASYRVITGSDATPSGAVYRFRYAPTKVAVVAPDPTPVDTSTMNQFAGFFAARTADSLTPPASGTANGAGPTHTFTASNSDSGYANVSVRCDIWLNQAPNIYVVTTPNLYSLQPNT